MPAWRSNPTIRSSAAVPMPDTALLPPLTAKDVEPTAAPATSRQDRAGHQLSLPDRAEAGSRTPAAEPAKVNRPRPRANRPPRLCPPVRTARSPISCARWSPASSTASCPARPTARASKPSTRRATTRPLWVSDGAADERAKSAIAYLAQVDTVGLDPNDYPTPDFKSAATAEALAEDELKFTASVLTYARQAQIGRIHFTPRRRRHPIQSGRAGAGRGAGQARR